MNNQINISCLKGSVAEEDESDPMIYPMEPMGVGSGQLESLTGLTLRLADRHSIMTSSFYKHVINPLVPSALGRIRCHKLNDYYSANGYAKNAKRISTAISVASKSINAFYTTLLPWEGVFDPYAHGLIKTSMEWCAQCWEEDVLVGNNPYVRLVWQMKPYSICTHHRQKLKGLCPHCDSQQPVLPKIPRPWLCDNCGNELNKKQSLKSIDSVSDEKEVWFSSVIERLVERTCSQGRVLEKDSLTFALQGIVDQHFNGSYDNFSKMTKVNKRYLREWSLGIRKPAFMSFLDLCYRMDIPPDVLLMNGLPLTDPGNWRKLEATRFVKMRKLSMRQKDEIHAYLKRVISENNIPPEPLSRIAKRFRVTYVILNYHFPDEYSVIKQRYDKYRNVQKVNADKKRMNNLEESINKLVKEGLYPSERKLKERKLVLISDLRRQDVRDHLHELQIEL